MTITLLDGGMGQELVKRSAFPASPMWSAKVLLDEPEIVQAAHEDFIRAGAQVITINAYSATPERLEHYGKLELFETLQARAIDLANKARDAAGRDVKIAGCLPPLFGSYAPDLTATYDERLQRYREIAAQQKGRVDLIQCETMASITEATAACTAAVETGLPVWVGLTVADDDSANLRSGEPLQEALDALSGMGAEAILLNCSVPESITACLPIVAATGVRFGAYANGFTSVTKLTMGKTVDGLTARRDLTPEIYANHVDQWIALGATIVGGCCEVGPAHIAEISRRLHP